MSGTVVEVDEVEVMVVRMLDEAEQQDNDMIDENDDGYAEIVIIFQYIDEVEVLDEFDEIEVEYTTVALRDEMVEYEKNHL